MQLLDYIGELLGAVPGLEPLPNTHLKDRLEEWQICVSDTPRNELFKILGDVDQGSLGT